MKKIFAIGETTYDIVFRNGQPVKGVVGGSVLNTSVSLGRLHLPIYFLSRFGNDRIGNLSAQFLSDNGVNCNHIKQFDGQSRIALAFLDQENNASYQFYQGNKTPKLSYPEVEKDDMIAFGSLNALKEKGRKELLRFLTKGSDRGAMIVYDPNIRNFAEQEREEIIAKVEENISYCTILKGSSEDFIRLYRTANADELFPKFQDMGVKALIITDGAQPTILRTVNLTKSYQVEQIQAISTIGAGDNFTAGLLYGLWKNTAGTAVIDSLDETCWDEIIGYGNHFAAEVCQSEENYLSVSYANSVLNS